VRGSLDVGPEHKQPAGVVHGGVYAALAESAASAGTYVGVVGDGKTALGISNSTSFMRPVTEGKIHASGKPRHQGRTTWVWDVEMTNDDGKLCAVSRVTVAVR
jgi:1,4-dihydroxy-2-naphthoyl-CoA hydrolase